jgi:hypothetical protein
VGISQDDESATAEFLEYFKITFAVLLDAPPYAMSISYGLTNVPSLFLLEQDGRVTWTLNGFHKADLESLAARFGVELFGEFDKVPAMKPG